MRIQKTGIQRGIGQSDSIWALKGDECHWGRWRDTEVFYDQYGNRLVVTEEHEDDDWPSSTCYRY